MTVRTQPSLSDYLREKIFQTEDVERPELSLSDVSLFGVETKNISQEWIQSSAGEMGAWYMTPGDHHIRTAVLTVHGVKCNRGRSYRVGLYNVLLKLGCSVLAFDYRGFGDSAPCSLDESTVVSDTMLAYDWLRRRVGPAVEIIVFGHSLGAAVATHAVSKITAAEDDDGVKALILMSPFNNFTDQIMRMTQTNILLKMIYSVTGGYLVSSLLRHLNMEFRQDQHISSVPCPVLILHAEDDDKISSELALKLADAAREMNHNVKVNVYPASLNYGHHDIYKDSSLPQLLTDFLN